MQGEQLMGAGSIGIVILVALLLLAASGHKGDK